MTPPQALEKLTAPRLCRARARHRIASGTAALLGDGAERRAPLAPADSLRKDDERCETSCKRKSLKCTKRFGGGGGAGEAPARPLSVQPRRVLLQRSRPCGYRSRAHCGGTGGAEQPGTSPLLCLRSPHKGDPRVTLGMQLARGRGVGQWDTSGTALSTPQWCQGRRLQEPSCNQTRGSSPLVPGKVSARSQSGHARIATG